MTSRQKRDKLAAGPDYPKDLMVKTKSCQRMAKEYHFYLKEVTENEAKLAKLKEGNSLRDPNAPADTFDVENFSNVLAESYMMVPDSKARLVKSLEDLGLFIELHKDNESVKASAYYEMAVEVLKVEGGGEAEGGVTETVVELGEEEVF